MHIDDVTQSDEDARRLRKSLNLTVVLAVVVPTFGGGTVSTIAGFVPFPNFFLAFLGPPILYPIFHIALGLFAVHLIHRRIVALAKQATETARQRLARYIFILPTALVLWLLFVQLSGAALHHRVMEGPDFLTEGTYLRNMPLIAAKSVFAWGLPALVTCVDALGRYLAPREIAIGTVSMRTKVIGLGILSPLLVSVIAAEFLFPDLTQLASEAVIAWSLAMGLAVLLTVIVWQSTSLGLEPLRTYAARRIKDPDDEAWRDIAPVSLDELGEYSLQLRAAEKRRYALRRALTDSERHLRDAHRIAGIGGFVLSRDNTFTWREEVKLIFGLNDAKPLDTFDDFCARRVEPDSVPRLSSAIAQGWLDRKSFSCVFGGVRDDGAKLRLRMQAQVQADEYGDGLQMVGIIQDVTEFALLENKLRQSQKMEAVGQLTGGVAHDFNNLMAVILGNIELIEDNPTAKEAHLYLASAKSAVLRGSDLTKSLLSFAGQSRLEPTAINLNKTVREVEAWSSRVLPETIDMEVSLLAGLWLAEADPSLTQNALLNLILNARDAMPNGGRMTIETSNVRIDNEYLLTRGETFETGRYVLLAVSDTGQGIPKDRLAQIFEPFFTTKPVGSGSGLGLSMVQGFMKQSGGTVRVYSEEGIGTTFKLYFKAAEKVEDTDFPESGPDVSLPDPHARILIVEDDAAVLDVLKTTLAKEGYEVVSAQSGDEALRIWNADPNFDIVVTDIVMPGSIQGTHLARNLRERRPDLPVVFMSGYAREATVHGNGLRPQDVRLMKPVQRADLLNAIHSTMNHPKGQ